MTNEKLFSSLQQSIDEPPKREEISLYMAKATAQIIKKEIYRIAGGYMMNLSACPQTKEIEIKLDQVRYFKSWVVQAIKNLGLE